MKIWIAKTRSSVWSKSLLLVWSLHHLQQQQTQPTAKEEFVPVVFETAFLQVGTSICQIELVKLEQLPFVILVNIQEEAQQRKRERTELEMAGLPTRPGCQAPSQ